jgi:thiamine-phosphate pyrophosphorylase
MILDLYVITDPSIAGGLSHEQIALRAIAGGADVIQLRDKQAGGAALLAAARVIREITSVSGVLFIVNDRLDLALAAGADGVHLGRDDLPVREARRITPPGFIIGASVGTLEEAVSAVSEGADYIALSPTFDTASKDDAGPGKGLDTLRVIRLAVDVPVIAIGGIGPGNVADVLDTGADGVAVISAVVGEQDITAAAARLKRIIRERKRFLEETRL